MRKIELACGLGVFLIIALLPYLFFSLLNLDFSVYNWDSITRGLYGVLQFVWVVWGAINMINNY